MSRLHVWLAALLPVTGLVTLAAAVLVVADPGRATITIALTPSFLGAASDRFPLLGHEAVVRRIARVMTEEFALPLPDRITLRAYGSPALFEQGLVEDLHVAPSLAARLGRFAAGASYGRELLLLEPESARGARSWMRLVAHEMTHLAQTELARGDERGARWIAEGMADWVAFTVLDRLDVSDMAPERTLILDAALAWLRRGDVRLDLGALGEPGRFLDHAASDGAVPTYRLAFLLADRLITRYGLAKVAEYFRAFRASPDEALNFERAFGLRVGEFEGEVLGLPGASPAPVPLAHGGQGERG